VMLNSAPGNKLPVLNTYSDSVVTAFVLSY